MTILEKGKYIVTCVLKNGIRNGDEKQRRLSGELNSHKFDFDCLTQYSQDLQDLLSCALLGLSIGEKFLSCTPSERLNFAIHTFSDFAPLYKSRQSYENSVIKFVDSLTDKDNEDIIKAFAFKQVNYYLNGERRNSGHSITQDNKKIFISNECFEELLDKDFFDDKAGILYSYEQDFTCFDLSQATVDYIKTFNLPSMQEKILICWVLGYSEQSTAEKYHISINTVKKHRQTVKAKMQDILAIAQ